MSSLPLISLFQQANKYKRLCVAKRHTFSVINHYAQSEHEKYQQYAEKILNCSNELKIRLLTDFTTEGIITQSSIENARWCRCRQCPMCQFARASKHRAKFFKAFAGVDLFQRDYAFLTLTHRNRPLNELRDSLSEMTEGWHRFSRRRTFPVTGWLRSMEVTMQRQRLSGDKKKNTGPAVRSPDGQLMSHPHFHILLEMEPGYFENNLKKTEWWSSEWQSAIRCDYGPTVFIRKIRAGNDGDFSKALLETAKYCTKPEDFGEHPDAAEWLYGITEQLHGLRSIRVGASFSKLLSQKELDKIDIDCSDYEEHSQFGKLLTLSWNDISNRWDISTDDEDEELS